MWRLLRDRQNKIKNREENKKLIDKWNFVLDGRRHCEAVDLFDVRAFMLYEITENGQNALTIINIIEKNQDLIKETIKIDSQFDKFLIQPSDPHKQ